MIEGAGTAVPGEIQAPPGESRGRQTSLPRRVLALAGGMIAGTTLGLLIAAVVATQFFGFQVLAVQSASMEPGISTGDFVVSRPVAAADVEEGDVIVFTGEQDVAIAHRVVRIVSVVFNIENSDTGEVTTESVEYRFTTRGDANPINDSGVVTADRLLGELWFSLPGYGLGDSAFPIQPLLFGFAAAFGVVWIAWELVSRRERNQAA